MASTATRTGRRAREPYRDLAADLRELIRSGQLLPGARLPAARELATQHGVALTTAVRAVAMLRDEGLVTTTHGRGSYVSTRTEITRGDATRYRRHPEGLSPNRDEAEAGGYLDEVDRSERDEVNATTQLAERLRVPVGTPLSVVHYRWLAGGTPTQISTQYEPLSITADTAAEVPASALRGAPSVIARFERIGWTVTRVEEDYRARMPTRDELAALELPDGVPVLAITRTHYGNGPDGIERPIETADITVRGDRVAIHSTHTLSEQG